MKASEPDGLRATVAPTAKEFGVDVYVDTEEMEASRVQVSGTRSCLQVSRGSQQRDRVPNYAPDTRELVARIARDSAATARDLSRAKS